MIEARIGVSPPQNTRDIAAVLCLAGVLILNIVGCSTSTETGSKPDNGSAAISAQTEQFSTKPTATEQTDDTPTETDSDSPDPAETTLPEANSDNSSFYGIDELGLRYDLPEGFYFTEVNTDIDLTEYTEIAFEAENEDADLIQCTIIPLTDDQMAEVDNGLVEDYAEYKALDLAEFLETYYDETVVSKIIGETTLNSGEKLTSTVLDCVRDDGQGEFVSQVFAVRGKHLIYFTIWAWEDSTLKTIVSGLTLQ